MKGRICRLIAVVLAVSFLVAIGAPAKVGLAQEPPRFEGVTLHISSIADIYAQGFSRFEDDIYAKFGIKMEFDNTAPQDAYKKDMLEFSAETATHDIVLFMPAWLPDYAPHLEPMGDLAKQYNLDFKLDDVVPIFQKFYTEWDGEFYTVPWDGDQHNLYYNKGAFNNPKMQEQFKEEYGYDLLVPETWDQYRDVANFFNGKDWNDDGKNEFGVAEAWQRGGYAFWWWANKFLGFGGVWFDEDMKPLINGPVGIRALENTLSIKESVPPGTANFGYPELENAFIKGEVPMVMQWDSTGKRCKDPSASTIVDQCGIAMLPGSEAADGTVIHRPGLPTGWTMGIPKYSTNKEAAAYLLQYISDFEHSLINAMDPAIGADPWRKSHFEDPKWLTMWPDDPEYSEAYIDVLQKTVEMGVPDLQIPGSYEYWQAADREIAEAIAGNKTAQEAMDAAAAEWENITDRYGRDTQRTAWNKQLEGMKSLGITYMPDLAK